MPKIVRWKTANVDADWKREVVKQNERRAVDTINGLTTILFGGLVGTGPVDFDGQCDCLRDLTGAQIADALQEYWRVTKAELAQGGG